MSEPFTEYLRAKERTETAEARHDYTGALVDKLRIEQRMAGVISQYEPVASLGIDRDKLAVVLHYVRTGQMRKEGV